MASKSAETGENLSENADETICEEDDERMWAAVSFVVILIIIGVPLWWKMTEVERSYFPYEDIADLRSQNISFGLNIHLHAITLSAKKLENDLNILFSQSDAGLFTVNVQPSAHEFRVNKSISELENMIDLHRQNSGEIQIVEVPSLKPEEIVIGRHRTIYISNTIKPRKIYDFLQDVLLHENMLLESVKTVISPGLMSDNTDYLRKVRPSPKYDVIFTVINSQPEKVNFDWNNKLIIEKYFRSMLNQLSALSEFRIRSQWLYLIDLQQTPKRVEDHFELNMMQIPHIITPLEKKIGSGVAQNPCINFVLYVTKCEHSPTVFIDERGQPTNAILSARWGGVQIVNPNRTHCEENHPMVANSKAIMRTFLFQFRTLLGLLDVSRTGKVLPADDVVVYPWEVDSLYRMRVLELFVSSRITLTSLSQLLGEISNIVITDGVSNAVLKAVEAAQNTLRSLSEKNLTAALNFSTQAFISSEFAFTHPSLLALLYFPDDQKYAVYIPLYLPVMIPVLLSLKNIRVWLKKKLFKNKDDAKKND